MENRYRRMAVEALRLAPGDTVVDVACGTGLNFSLLQAKVGAEGRIIGVDLTDEMLEQARRRVKRSGWDNVELVQTDAAAYDFPHGVNGILSTCAITLVPEYDEVIARGAAALATGGRLVVFDLKEPGRWPEWAIRAYVAISRPFAVTRDLGERKPWESIARHFPVHAMVELYGGAAYVAVGEKEA
jgi:demethylmenaquinone methyltransferase/2-methoxy-6-polyprenyl-1,4-benzoquinol methylase